MLQRQKQALSGLPILLVQAHEIRMEVVFGTPSQNCIGSGVCMVMNRPSSRRHLPCPHTPAWISFEQNLLVFRFPKAEVIRPDVLIRLDGPWFLVQESFQIPRHVATKLGLPSNWVLPGVYAIEESAKDWEIAFCLSQ